MASAAEPHRRKHNPIADFSRFIQSTATNLSSTVLSPITAPFSPISSSSSSPSKICIPLLFSDSQPQPLSLPSSPSSDSTRSDTLSSRSSSGFPSTVRISGLDSSRKNGGPAFVGQVFSMCDLSGTGLMAVSTHFDIPFISKRTPEWLKKMFSTITKSERKGPVFRFFMDLGDAVSYVKRLNIPSGVVGACRLDLAFERFKEKPHLFQFVPNDKQVKEANKLLKRMPDNGGMKKVDGVPVFSSQNMDIAIATTDGIKWYTPYFFDKNMLDNILEESVDQHFNSLIQTRDSARWRVGVDDNLTAEVVDEIRDTLEPPEIEDLLDEMNDEMNDPGMLWSALSKAAENELFHAVDRVVLGNKWLRKAAGIQPKFPYVVDSFEKRSAASLRRMSGNNEKQVRQIGTSGIEDGDGDNVQAEDFRFPFGDWFSSSPWSKHHHRMMDRSREYRMQEVEPSPFLPKITMVGISTGDSGQMSKLTLKKTMDDLTVELEKTENNNNNNDKSEFKFKERDPLFVANVGDYYSAVSKSGSARWVRGGSIS